MKTEEMVNAINNAINEAHRQRTSTGSKFDRWHDKQYLDVLDMMDASTVKTVHDLMGQFLTALNTPASLPTPSEKPPAKVLPLKPKKNKVIK